jgi:hypothetical protein
MGVATGGSYRWFFWIPVAVTEEKIALTVKHDNV